MTIFSWLLWTGILLAGVVLIRFLWDKVRPAKGITDFNGKVILITGASSGIGMALARKFSGLGAKLVLVARRGEILQSLKSELARPDGDVLIIPADIGNVADLEAVVKQSETHYGHLDVLINNAGIVDTEPLENIDAERVLSLITTNLIAPINLIRLALPLLRKPTQAAIVNVTSTVGVTLVPRQATYGASKAGLNGFTDAMRRELHGTGISVSMVMPGLVNTPMLRGEKNLEQTRQMLEETGMAIPGVSLDEADDVADKVIHAIRHQKRDIIMGGWLFGFLSQMGQHTPNWLDWVYVQMFKSNNLQDNVAGKE
jgi:short-subunit dehydrogenase